MSVRQSFLSAPARSSRTTWFRNSRPAKIMRHPRWSDVLRDSVPIHAFSSKSEMCVIVDEQNRIVGAEPRSVTVKNRLLGRGSYVLVFNSSGQLLVSRRSRQKDVYPGHLDVVISGVVTLGEDYRTTAIRELGEEIGMDPTAARAELKELFIFPYKDSSCHVWGCAFSVCHEGMIHLQAEEVEWALFLDLPQVEAMLENETFTPVGRHVLQRYLRSQQELSQDVTTH